ncbi:hypothetical protein EIN_425070 [Entamoeba invadens IP1]|uniref:USP domain-containing protein n=1 Tax=Entamoeba invadens IP1 TaxID=370355 RepID=A0A0A1U632_ENTIV|nr:hypothetical protein EIN_425070 [Entamoeba invadens IP1]ELP89785.1 hypothetical protein EIN_425070 [Entamoeba invadens IP1]|eukprot:XP_004256556.1 hypothetical protein EIN_425070 [Entamoeba invadens IP1]
MAKVKTNDTTNSKVPLYTMDNVSEGNPHIVGLMNLGSTCYLNSIMQQMYADYLFRNTLLLADGDGMTPFLSSVQTVFLKMMKEGSAVDPRKEVNEMRNERYGMINPSVQRDAAEMFLEIIDSISEETSPSVLHETLKGMYTTEILDCIKMPNAVKEEQRIEEHVILPIEIRGLNKLEDSLKLLNTVECVGEKGEIKKQVFLHRIPHTLVFQLKRFSFNTLTFQQEKINTVFTGTCNGGHYTSYVRTGNQWTLIDDNQVIEVKKEAAENDWFGSKNKSAYLLFYRKVSESVEIPILDIKSHLSYEEESFSPIEQDDKKSKGKGKAPKVMMKGKKKPKRKELKFDVQQVGIQQVIGEYSDIVNYSSRLVKLENGKNPSERVEKKEQKDLKSEKYMKESEEYLEYENDLKEVVLCEKYLFEQNVFFVAVLEYLQSGSDLFDIFVEQVIRVLNARQSTDCDAVHRMVDNLTVGGSKKQSTKVPSTVVLNLSRFVANLHFTPHEVLNRYLCVLIDFLSGLELSNEQSYLSESLYGSAVKIITELKKCDAEVPSDVVMKYYKSLKTTHFIQESTGDISQYINIVYLLYTLFDVDDVRGVLYPVSLINIFKTGGFAKMQSAVDYTLVKAFLRKVYEKLPTSLLKAQVLLKVFGGIDKMYAPEDEIEKSPLYEVLIDLIKQQNSENATFFANRLEEHQNENVITNEVLYMIVVDCAENHLKLSLAQN